MPDRGRGLRDGVEARLEDLPAGRRERSLLARRALAAEAGGGRLSVLDAGCEYGAFSLSLLQAHPTWDVEGVDLRPDAVAEARRRAERAGLPAATFREADLTRPWTGRTHDAVVCLECLVEIPDDAAALRTLRAALRPGGLLLVQVPTSDWRPLLKGSEGSWRREARRGYTQDELRRLLQEAGFEQVTVRPTFRVVAQLAQEVRDRYRDSSLKTRVALLPLSAAAAWLDGHALTWGPPRAWWVQARAGQTISA